MNLFDLLNQDNFHFKRVAASHGGEYAGPCPWCGGKDRFRLWPDEEETGRYWCRQCDKRGDSIQYLREFKGMSFKDACNFLNLTDKLQRPSGPRVVKEIKQHQDIWQARTVETPGDIWQGKAKAFIEFAEKNLAENKAARQYLFDRGLNADTITAGRIGWNPKTLYMPREAWGLPVIKDKAGFQKVWLPCGYVLPCGAPGALHGLKIRIADRKENQPKYYNLPGSVTAPFILGSIPIIFIVESELDAFLIKQEAGDLVTVAALGSAQNKPCTDTLDIFKNALALFVSLDTDDRAGYLGAAWWCNQFFQAVRWPVPVGKDPSEAWQHGLNVRVWVQAAIESFGKNSAILKLAIEKSRQEGTAIKKKEQALDTDKENSHVYVSVDIPEPCRGCFAQDEGNCLKKINRIPCAEMLPSCEFVQRKNKT